MVREHLFEHVSVARRWSFSALFPAFRSWAPHAELLALRPSFSEGRPVPVLPSSFGGVGLLPWPVFNSALPAVPDPLAVHELLAGRAIFLRTSDGKLVAPLVVVAEKTVAHFEKRLWPSIISLKTLVAYEQVASWSW